MTAATVKTTVAAPRPGQLTVLRPASLDAALAARAEHPSFRPLAGGTDLMVQLHAGVPAPAGVIDLWGLDALRELRVEATGVRLGALTTFAAILTDPDLLAGWPLLVEAAAGIGAVQIRNRATLGGNVVNASPAGDSLPPLVVYGAELELASVRGRRRVPVLDFYRGYKELDLAPDELLVAVEIPRPSTGLLQRFRKVGTRRAQAIAKLSVALLLARDAASGRLYQVRLACGAVGPTVLRLPGSEALLEGQELTPALIEAVRAEVEAEVRPIDDVRSSADYRRRAAGRIVARFLSDLL